MSRSVIFALDGVLANHEHRRVPEGTDVPWREEYDQNRMEEDAPYRDMLKLCQQLGERNSILIITERPITVMEVTRKWLGGVDVEFDMLYMKQDVKRRSATGKSVV